MRYRKTKPVLPALAISLALGGVIGSALWAAQRETWPGPLFSQLQDLTRLDAVRVFPRTTRILTAMDARGELEAGRPWEAWKLLRDEVTDGGSTPDFVMLGARAAAGWNGWTNVRSLLNGRDWLADVDNGDGWFLLARAEEELGNGPAAADAYRAYLRVSSAKQKGEAAARLGGVLSRAKDPRAAAEAYALAARELPDVEDWMLALQLEQEIAGGRAPAGPGTAFRAAGSAARTRRVLAEANGWMTLGDPTRATARLGAEESVLHGQGALAEAATVRLRRAELLVQASRAAEARELLRVTAADSGARADTRMTAARMLGEMEGRTAQEELAISAAYEAGKRPGLAAKALREAMSGSRDGALQMKLGRLLYDERDFGPARVAFERAAEVLTGAEQAEAELYATRSLYRGNSRTASTAIAELKRIVERHPNTPAAGSASFLLGDLSSTLATARGHYRRAASVRSSPDAREALLRVGDRSLKLKETAAAIQAWEEYVEIYPTGDATARVAYETARLHERAGRTSRARTMYAAAMKAEPTSYYAMRAGERTDADPLDAVLAEPRPWAGLAADPAAAAAVLRRLDVLRSVGLQEEWTAEFDAARRAFAKRPAAAITLAEGVRDQGYPVQAINMGWELREQRGHWDVRLLRVIWPFNYRGIIEREADRKGIDPFLLAGLIRQESTFRHDIKSRVGATGLGQIMPATGKWLAPSAGIRNWDPSLLEVPEVNVRMGAGYLGDLLDQYDGNADLALSGYNAGPSRATRWRRELPRDRDAFRDAIPFEETRNYVKVVLRNAELYRRLYGGRGAASREE